MIGIINNIKEIEYINKIKGKEISISIIIIIIYKITNYWIEGKKEIEIIMMINIIGIILLIINNKEIGIIYIIIEIYTMTIYIIINYNNKRNIYNNLKYFFINSFSSLLLLLIIAIIYYNKGIYNIEDYKYIEKEILYNILLFILIFKLGIFPFNYWLMDSYKAFDIKILYFQTIFSQFIYLYLLFLFPFSPSLFFFSILNLIFIPILAFKSFQLKDLLLFSSLFNFPFLLSSLYNIHLFLYYFFLYSLNSFSLFFSLLYPNPFFFFFLFSLIGFPPFSGFFIKFYLLFNLSLLPSSFSPFFILLLSLSTLLSSVFYLRILNFLSLPITSLSSLPSPFPTTFPFIIILLLLFPPFNSYLSLLLYL